MSDGLRRDNRISCGRIGEGAGAGIDVIEKRTAKERVHMYAGDAGT